MAPNRSSESQDKTRQVSYIWLRTRFIIQRKKHIRSRYHFTSKSVEEGDMCFEKLDGSSNRHVNKMC